MGDLIGADAQRIIDRLAAIDRANPALNVRLAEEALAEHFAMLGMPCPPIRWVRDVCAAGVDVVPHGG